MFAVPVADWVALLDKPDAEPNWDIVGAGLVSKPLVNFINSAKTTCDTA